MPSSAGVLIAVAWAFMIAAATAAANQPPSLARLDGLHVSLAPGGEARLNLSDYLVDADDAFSNFTFALAWDNGSVVRADILNGTLEIRSLTSVAAHARVTVVATDSAGGTADATVEVEAQGAPLSAEGLAALLVAVLVGLGVGWLFLRAYKKGRLADSGGAPSPREPRVELPAPMLLAAGGSAAASSLFLLHRDGTVLAWARTDRPSAADTEKAQALAGVLAEGALRTREGEAVEGETIDYGGSRVVFEGRSRLFLGALIAPGADEAPLRERMRAALARIAEENPEGLAGSDGQHGTFQGVKEGLDEVVRG